MKYFILFLLIPFLCPIGLSQPTLQWQKTIGGNYTEKANAVYPTSDQGYILAGITFSSNNGQVSAGFGGGDFWIVKLDNLGDVQWEKVLGGSSTDVAESIQQTSEGGYIVTGRTFSNDGQVMGNHGDMDIWVVKLNNSGEIEWQKTLGGTGEDDAYCILQTSDTGFIVAGRTTSQDGDTIGNLGIQGGWIIKLDALGNIQWQKVLGGENNTDYIYSIENTSDGGFILTGLTYSIEGSLSSNHGSGDVWVAKLSGTGDIAWQKAFGGIGVDIGRSIKATSDGGYVVACSAASGNSGDVSGNHGGLDAWILKLNSSGEIEWQKSLGGSNQDWGHSIFQSNNGNLYVAGTTRSTDGDVLDNDGNQDLWAVALSSTGTLLWQKTLGGIQTERANSLVQANDGGLLIAGETDSNDGDVTNNNGSYDFWVVKLSPIAVNQHTPQTLPLEIYPNPTPGFITINIPQHLVVRTVSVVDILGRDLGLQTTWNGKQLDVSSLPAGLYLAQVVTQQGLVFAGKLKKD